MICTSVHDCSRSNFYSSSLATCFDVDWKLLLMFVGIDSRQLVSLIACGSLVFDGLLQDAIVAMFVEHSKQFLSKCAS